MAKHLTELTERFTNAVDFARKVHSEQERKGKDVPYLGHVLAVAALVIDHGGSEEQCIAAVLHDTIEDGGGPKASVKVRKKFGETVAAIVEALSDAAPAKGEDKAPWWERKVEYVRALEAGEEPDGAYLVCAADKLVNLTDTLFDHQLQGSEVWAIFKSGRQGQVWYYTRLSEVLSPRLCTNRGRDLARRFELEVANLWNDIVSDPREKVTQAELLAEYRDACEIEQSVRVELEKRRN